MDRNAIIKEVEFLLARQEELHRLRLALPPDQGMLLKRLLYRLGWTTQYRRTQPLKMARRPPVPSNTLVDHAAAVLDDPLDNTAMMSLADHIQESGLHPELADNFLKWVSGEPVSVLYPQLGLSNPYIAFVSNKRREGPWPDDAPMGEKAIELRPVFKHQGEPLGIHSVSAEGRKHPGFEHVYGIPGWRRIVYTENGPRGGRPTRHRPYTSREVAHEVYTRGGLVSLLHAIIGARQFHPEKGGRPARSPSAKFRRRSLLPKKYAKIDGHEPAHHLIAGFPIEHALRHLANDSSNVDDVRNIALAILRGNTEGLYALNDKLQEVNHPAKDWYNWMSAADKVHYDHHTYNALSELAYVVRRSHNVSARDNTWAYTPEGQAMRVVQALGKQEGLDPLVKRRNKAALDQVRTRVGQLVPGLPQEMIDESIRRHAHRAWQHWRERRGIDNTPHTQQALGSIGDVDRSHPAVEAHKNEKATRYRRRPIRFNRHSDFHRMMLDDPKDQTNHLVYADFLEENGNTAAAEFIRRSVEARRNGVLGNHGVVYFNDPVTVHGEPLEEGRMSVDRVAVAVSSNEVPQIALRVNTGIPNRRIATWYLPMDRDDPGKEEFLGRLAKEGVTIYRGHEGGYKHLSRQGKPQRYAKSHRGDFLDSLRRIQSSNQKALHMTADQVAKKLGLHPIKVFDALHDTPHGSTPGIAQAVYGPASPEQIHAAGAWIGLTSNIPGVSVFHPRPNGPDVLYRWSQEGSGLDLRTKMDRHGITERILIPNKKGFDVVIPDKGGRLSRNVQSYAKTHNVSLETSPGYFSAIGSLDQSRARDLFRKKIVKSEKMSRRYAKIVGDASKFAPQIRQDIEEGSFESAGSHDILADYLSDHGDPREHIVRNRNPQAYMTAARSAKVDAWNAGPIMRYQFPDRTHMQTIAFPHPTMGPPVTRFVQWGGDFGDHYGINPGGEPGLPWYSTAMTEEEYQNWLSKFDEGHGPQPISNMPPSDRRYMGRRMGLRRYSAWTKHSAFMKAMRDNPTETYHSLIYADYLEGDHGKPAHAHIVRKNAEQYKDNGVFGLATGPLAKADMDEGTSWIRVAPNDYDSWMKRPPTSYTIQLHIRSGLPGPYTEVSTAYHKIPVEEAYDLMQRLQDEGANLEPSNQWAREILDNHFNSLPKKASRRRYATPSIREIAAMKAQQANQGYEAERRAWLAGLSKDQLLHRVIEVMRRRNPEVGVTRDQLRSAVKIPFDQLDDVITHGVMNGLLDVTETKRVKNRGPITLHTLTDKGRTITLNPPRRTRGPKSRIADKIPVVAEMRSQGFTQKDVGEHLGVSPQRIGDIDRKKG